MHLRNEVFLYVISILFASTLARPQKVDEKLKDSEFWNSTTSIEKSCLGSNCSSNEPTSADYRTTNTPISTQAAPESNSTETTVILQTENSFAIPTSTKESDVDDVNIDRKDKENNNEEPKPSSVVPKKGVEEAESPATVVPKKGVDEPDDLQSVPKKGVEPPALVNDDRPSVPKKGVEMVDGSDRTFPYKSSVTHNHRTMETNNKSQMSSSTQSSLTNSAELPKAKNMSSPASVQGPTVKKIPQDNATSASLLIGVVFGSILLAVVGFLLFKRIDAARRRREYRRMNDFLIDGMYNDL